MLELAPPLLAMTIVGVIAFAASGAVAGARAGMDWLGLTTLAAVTAIGGGTLRDLLMVQTPGWLLDFWPTVALIGVTVVAVWITARVFPWQRYRHWMARLFTLSDAIGLAAFTVVGTDIALDGGFAAGPAVILGVISGVGGGIIRDVLAGRRIAIFTGEVYALAALAGSVAFLASRGLGPLAPFLIGVSITLIIRLGAVTMGWRVPTLPSD
ncbi:MAG: TRIC cation channel family protein, partial [Candidatus Nanopelagicales bacterium]|nr:TRIC cation channel family protein [Candidatus Nanopelagicales bacterium]MCF8542828.1 TRIC cation channel family protein [Candidatus Nanopelagicales bacterium]